MGIIPKTVKLFKKRRINQIAHFRKYPVETQKDVLFGLIKKASGTEWGIKYDYRSIVSVKDFQSRVPVAEL